LDNDLIVVYFAFNIFKLRVYASPTLTSSYTEANNLLDG